MDDIKTQLKTALKQNAVEVFFKKIDGSERKMTCTLKEDILPALKISDAKKKKENDGVVVVWDLHKDAFRSFRLDSLITWTVLKEGYEL